MAPASSTSIEVEARLASLVYAARRVQNMTQRLSGVATLCALTVTSASCKTPGGMAQGLAQAPTLEATTGEAKCGVRASSAKPLVVEWPATERAALEARASRSLVAVRYEGCHMEVLTTCKVSGEYEYLPLTQKREGVRITNADDLYAQLPVGAASLEAKLERSGQLNVDMVIVGRREATRSVFDQSQLQGRCGEATHVITGLTVGAFDFYSGAAAEVGGSATVRGAGVGGSSSSGTEMLKSDGDPDACGGASTDDEAPPQGCAALLRVEVVPIDRAGSALAAAPHTTTPNRSGPPSHPAPKPAGAPSTPSKDDRAAYNRDMKSAKALTSLGYLGIAGGILTASLGVSRYAAGKSELEGEVGNTEVSSERPDNIRKARVGLTLGYVGAGIAVAGLGVLVWGALRAKRARVTRTVALEPAVSPTFAGVALGGRF